MSTAEVLRSMVADEQSEFVALLRTLTPQQWESPSLCEGWSVLDVVIHSANHSHSTGTRLVAQLARARFNEARQMAPFRRLTTDELTAWMASPPTLGRSSMNIRLQLAELAIHQQDVRRAVGIHRRLPADRLSVLLDFGLTRYGGAFVASARRRAKGLRLVAADIGWSAGTGPEVTGNGEAIFMAVNGRPDALEDLAGDGRELLRRRVAA